MNNGVATVDLYDMRDPSLPLRPEDVVLRDRERIAREIHDGPINEIISASLHLARMAGSLSDSLREDVDLVLDRHDTAVRQLRAIIFGLAPRENGRLRLSALITETTGDAARCLGFTPEVHMIGPVDDVTDPNLLGHLTAVLKELLSNIARHAAASAVTITLAVDDSTVELVVIDNGAGTRLVTTNGSTPPNSGYGLRNLATRARSLGGTFEISGSPGRGTTARWRVPRPPRR